jgi:hypothetical protein
VVYIRKIKGDVSFNFCEVCGRKIMHMPDELHGRWVCGLCLDEVHVSDGVPSVSDVWGALRVELESLDIVSQREVLREVIRLKSHKINSVGKVKGG